MERKFQNELQILLLGVKYKMYIKIITITHVFFPVRNPKKSHTRPLIGCCPDKFFSIWTAHLDYSRQQYNFEPILLLN